MKLFVSFASIFFLFQLTLADPPCDRILGAMSDGCKSIARQLLTIESSTDPNNICCTNYRYNVCTQSCKAYAAVARVTKICPDEHYTTVIDELDSNPLLGPIRLTCQNFSPKTCFTKQASSLWNEFKSGVNIDVDKLGDSINKNWNEALSSVSTLAKNITREIEQRSGDFGGTFKDKAVEFQQSVKKNFNEGRQKLKDMFSNGNANNRYSMVEDDQKSGDIDSFVHSIIPDVEFVSKPSEKIQEEPVKQFESVRPKANNGNSFMNFFHSIAGTLEAPSKPKPVAPESPRNQQNPYSL